MRATRVVLFVAFAGFAASAIFGVVSLAGHLTVWPFSRVVALVLLFFGLFKIAIAVDAVLAPPAVAPQSDQRQDTASPTIFRLWVAYKLVPAALAIAVAGWLFARGAVGLDALVR
jgi:hypothetical protein